MSLKKGFKMNALISIAAGGALGAVLRHGVNLGATRLAGIDFPWGTLSVNLVGSFAMGLLAGVFAHLWNPPQEVRLFLTTGILGGFTTFSAFSLDAALLWEKGQAGAAALYVGGSVLGAVALLFAGLALGRGLAS